MDKCKERRLKAYRVYDMTREELCELEDDVARRIDLARTNAELYFIDFTHEDYLAEVLDIISDLFYELGMMRLSSVFGGAASYSRRHVEEEREELEGYKKSGEGSEEVTE